MLTKSGDSLKKKKRCSDETCMPLEMGAESVAKYIIVKVIVTNDP